MQYVFFYLSIPNRYSACSIESPVNLVKVGFAISLTHTSYATVTRIKKVDRDRIKAFAISYIITYTHIYTPVGVQRIFFFDSVKIRRDLRENTIIFRNARIIQPRCTYSHSMPIFFITRHTLRSILCLLLLNI